VSSAPTVGHVVLHFGQLSETFVADAIERTDAAGCPAWLAALSVERRDAFPFPPPERVLTASRPSIPRRAVDRLLRRSPEERFAEQLAPRLARAGVEVLHAHFGWGGRYALPLARRLGLPLAVTFYGSDATTASSARFGPLLEQADRTIAPSDFVARALRTLRYQGHIDVIPPGIPLDSLTMRAGPPAGGLRLLFVGRLVPVKGADVLLNAMPHILRQLPGTTLELIGDGPERPALERLARTLGLEGSVAFRGARPRHEVLEALRGTHVAVVPSRTMPDGQAEASSVALKEALALGVPLVATRSGGLPETTPPAYRHELVRAGDHHALAERVIALARDRASWSARAKAGRAWVEERFNADILARRLAGVYRELAGGRRPTAPAPGAVGA
jgi:glycosyltransferase involved in cell wall biosynthesis